MLISRGEPDQSFLPLPLRSMSRCTQPIQMTRDSMRFQRPAQGIYVNPLIRLSGRPLSPAHPQPLPARSIAVSLQHLAAVIPSCTVVSGTLQRGDTFLNISFLLTPTTAQAPLVFQLETLTICPRVLSRDRFRNTKGVH